MLVVGWSTVLGGSYCFGINFLVFILWEDGKIFGEDLGGWGGGVIY